MKQWSILLAWTGMLLGCNAALQAAPSPDAWFYPAGAARGSTITVTAGGTFKPWPVQAWADSPGIHFKAEKEAGTFSVTLDKDAPVGPHLVRLYTDQGALSPRLFIVGNQPEVAEVEPNDEAAKAQPIATLPVTINGRLEKSGDADSFAVHLEQGQCLVASVQGRRIGSLIDPMLHLLDSSGTAVAFASDGLGLDPLLSYAAPQAGTYVVRITAFAYPPAADVRLAGGKGDVYRLSLTTGPFVRFAQPAGAVRGTRTPLQLLGWNLPPTGLMAEADATRLRSDQDHLFIPALCDGGLLRVELGGGPEWSEPPPNPIRPPGALTGVLSHPGDQHRLRFTGRKGEQLQVSVRAVEMNSPLDPALRILDESGKPLTRDSDSPGDPSFNWTVPADGTYAAVVADLYGRGGPDFAYRLELAFPTPDLRATADAHEYHLLPGASATVTLTIKRENGLNIPLVAVATGLPPGITATSAEVGDKGGPATLVLAAAPDAKPFSGPIRLLVLGTNPDHPLTRSATYPLHKDPGDPELIPETDAIWLTIQPKPPTTQPAK